MPRQGQVLAAAAACFALVFSSSGCAPPASHDTSTPTVASPPVTPSGAQGSGGPSTPVGPGVTSRPGEPEDPGSPGDLESSVRREFPGAQVVHGRRSLVVGPDRDGLAEVVQAADEAWQRCGAVWPEPLGAAVVVVDPATRTGRPGVARATATTVVVGPPGRGSARVHLSPERRDLSPEGLVVVLTHECVHVGLAARRRPPTPTWLVEGVAEYVAYRRSSITPESVWGPLREHVRRSGVPTGFPADADFALTGPAGPRPTDDLRLAYASAHSAVLAYVHTAGEGRLMAWVTTGPPAAERDPAAGLRRIEAWLLPRWQEELRRAAGS